MADYVLTVQAKRRVLLAAAVERAQAELTKRRAALRALDASVARYQESQTGRRPRGPREHQTIRLALTVLRAAPEPMTLRAVALRVMAARGQDATDAGVVRTMLERTRQSLLRQQRKGLVRATQGEGQAVLWTICS